MTDVQYPVCLNIAGQRCVVVGGGSVAARKVTELLRCGAEVLVVSPFVCDEMSLHVKNGVEYFERPFRPCDVDGALLVIAATDNRETNKRIAAAARLEKALVNVVDEPEFCLFTAPAVIRRGLLTVAISTSGASPALAGRLRREIDEFLDSEWELILEEINDFRQSLLRRIKDDSRRRGTVLRCLSELDLVDITRKEGREGLRLRLEKLVGNGENGDFDE